MEAIFITVGLLIRTVFLLLNKFSRLDIFIIAISLLVGAAIAAEAESLIGLPLGFAFAIAVFYKNKIIPDVTEGTLLLYGLAALFLYVQTHDISAEFTLTQFFIGTALSLFTAAMLILCLTKKRLGFSAQVTLVAIFLLVGMYIAYQGAVSFSVYYTSYLGQVLIGYYSLHFISSTLYLLSFFPIRPGNKHEAFRVAMDRVKKHASDLEEKYIDIDIHSIRTISILILFGLSFLYTHYYNDFLTAVVIMLTVGSIIAAPSLIEKHIRE